MTSSVKYNRIWKVSLPIILGGVAQNIVNVTDTAFLGRLDMIALGAAGNAGIFYFVLMVIGLGFSIGCQIIIGRRNGEENHKVIGELFATGFFFLMPLALVLFLFIQYFSPWILGELTASTEILQASNQYLNYRSFGVFFAFINFLFIAFYTGITRTRILTYATFLQAGVNVILDYGLIFGKFGFPAMGIEGAAIASVVSEIVAMTYFLTYSRLMIDYKKYGLFEKLNFEWKKFIKMMKVASPVMLQNFIALSSWLAFFMIIEQIGEQELATSHIIRSIYMVLMIPLFGFSSATSTLVSNLIGAGGKAQVLTLVKRVIYLSLACTALFLPLTILFPEELSRVYTDNIILIHAAKPLLYVISASMLFFSVAYISFSAVTGTGKTTVSLLIEAISISIYLFGAYWIGVKSELPLYLVWCSEFIYFGIMGTLAILYLKYGNWKSAKI